MFGFKKRAAARRERKERLFRLGDMIVRASQSLRGWSDGELVIEIPGSALLEPSTIRLRHWLDDGSVELFHRIDGLKVRISYERTDGYFSCEVLEQDPEIRQLLEAAYDYVFEKILAAEKEKKLADERYERLRKEAIKNMIAYETAE